MIVRISQQTLTTISRWLPQKIYQNGGSSTPTCLKIHLHYMQDLMAQLHERQRLRSSSRKAPLLPFTLSLTLPMDLVALVECTGDYINHPSEALILFDILCINSDSSTAASTQQLHSAMISRSLITFEVFAGVVHLSRIFRLHAHMLQVYHNGEPWELFSLTPRRLRTGDHVEVVFATPTSEDYRQNLVQWLRDEGVEPDQHLLATQSQTTPQKFDSARWLYLTNFADLAGPSYNKRS